MALPYMDRNLYLCTPYPVHGIFNRVQRGHLAGGFGASHLQKISTAVHDRTCQMKTYFFLLFSACIAASASRGAWHSVEYQGSVLAGLYLLVIQLSGQLLML